MGRPASGCKETRRSAEVEAYLSCQVSYPDGGRSKRHRVILIAGVRGCLRGVTDRHTGASAFFDRRIASQSEGLTMAQFQIWLNSWEHQCCGDQRLVGQEIELSVFRSRDRLYEERHDYMGGEGGGPVAVSMRGSLVALAWHRAILDRTGIFASILPVACCTSERVKSRCRVSLLSGAR